MIKFRKNKKTLKLIGKRWYDFDFGLERNIYCYLCCIRVKSRKLRKLNKELKFESYQQWNKYVRNKYEKFDKDSLSEFSRYLNQGIRNVRPDHEYWIIAATVILTVILTGLCDIFLKLKISFDGLSVISLIVVSFLLEFLVVIPIIFVIFQTIKPIIDSSVDENFLKDYKEIIDVIIMEKMKKLEI